MIAEYTDCLAALAAPFPDKVNHTHTVGRKLWQILMPSCMHDRLEYMFNEARFVRGLTKAEQETLQRGVTGNEACLQTMHLAPLKLKLEPV